MINVTNTYIPEKQKYLQYVDRIFENGWLTNNGELVQLLEKRLSEYLGVPYLVLTANGTLALQFAMKLLQIKER
jgi:dTDP-4-amino-4,6-dideoxygalactose transaminase